MRRTAIYVLIAVLAALIGAGALGAAWLAGTTDGARWLMGAVSRHTSLTISARIVKGRLLDGLQLEGVRLALAPVEVTIESIDFHWQPLLLLSGTVAAKELTLTGVMIRDNTPGVTPPDLAWPRVSGIAGLFDGKIRRLQVNGLTYRRLDGQPVNVTAISSSVVWYNKLLSLPDLAIIAPSGHVAGSIAAGFLRPLLQFDLTMTPAEPIAGMDAFTLQARLLPGRKPEQLAGGFTAAGASDKVKRLELSGEAGMARQVFNLRQLRLTGPGRRGTVTGGGTVTLTAGGPLLDLQIKAAGLDLTPEIKASTDLSGTLTLTGTPEQYRGEFAMVNTGKGWRTARLSGAYQGDGTGVKLAPLTGALLAGSVQGNLDVGWRGEFSLEGTIRGRNLNPAGISPDWAGVVNFDLTGSGAWPRQAPFRGEVSGSLLESRLHGQALTGELQANFESGALHVGSLLLQGKGFNISAAGNLGKRLAFDAKIGDLGRLIPQTAGELRADGWVRWHDGRLDGSLTGQGKNLAANGMRVAAANLTARLAEGKGYPLHVTATLRKAVYEEFQAGSVTLEADGTALRHTMNAVLLAAGAEVRIALSGVYDRGSWRGEIVRFSGRDRVGPWSLAAPAALSVAAGRITLAPLVLTGAQPERIEIAGELTGKPLSGSIRAVWNGIDLARGNPWLTEVRVAGAGAGNVQVRLAAGGQPAFSGTIGARGTVTAEKYGVTVERGSLSIEGTERSMHADIDLSLAGGGRLMGRFSSAKPVGLAIPGEGEVNLEWAGIDLLLFRPWLPRTINLEGRLAGRATGNLLPEQRFTMKGDTALSGGKVGWLRPEGEMNTSLRSASLSWEWRERALRGTAALALTEQGQVRGSFHLPIPARLPAALDRTGSLQASLTGQVREQGLLTSLFPGFIQESRGKLDADLRVNGTWEEPKIEGSLELAGAGAYLPTAGIHVKDIRFAMRLEKDLIRIDSFRAASGPGHIEGTALVRLKGWQAADYQGSINGERFQTVYLPELQILATPRLTFEGTPEKLAIRGEMRLPELLISGPPTRAVVLPSRDVILEGMPKPAEKTFPLALDVQVRLVLGEKVLVKAEGIDAQLGGGIDLVFRNLDKITSKGEIRVVKGRYRAFGADLEIVRGRLFYAGGPINQPTLDILALRTVGDVRAGITAGGLLRAPVIKLYSEPAMPDVDILAYILFGHPFGTSNSLEQAGMMAQVAGSLLSRGQSVSLQDQIKDRLGLSTLEIQSADVPGRMGYEPIRTTPPGIDPVRPAGDVSRAMLTVGKYLTPQLYFSYGRSLFTGGNLFRLRYDIFKHWQIETQTGSESGVDLYYKIEFD